MFQFSYILKPYMYNRQNDAFPLEINPYPAHKKQSASFLICFIFYKTLKSFKVVENIILVSNNFDPDQTASYSAFHRDPGCLYSYGTIVGIGRLRVNPFPLTHCSLGYKMSAIKICLYQLEQADFEQVFSQIVQC